MTVWDTLKEWLFALIPLAAGIVGWLVKRLTARLDAVEGELADHEASLTAHRLHTAENYVTREHLKETEGRIVAHLLRVEGKIDARK